MTEIDRTRRAARHEARARRAEQKENATSERHAQRGGEAGRGGGGRGSRRCCGQARHGGTAGRGALVEPAIVAALLREGGHGYDLRKAINEMTGGAISVDAGGLYRILRRMEEEGFVTSNWVEGDSGPQKREYELTSLGRELADDWVTHLEERAQLAGMLADELRQATASEEKPAT